MRKRLQYAMPRVPLVKLKQKKNDATGETDDPTGAAETMVGVMAKRIQQGNKAREIAPKRGKVPLGGDIEHDESDSEEDHFDKIQAGNNGVQGAAADERFYGPDENHLNRKAQNIGDQDLIVEKEEMDMMERLVAKIERQNKGKKLRLVLFEGDTDNIVAADEAKTKIKNDNESPEQLRTNEVSSATEVEVEAMVHYEDHEKRVVLQNDMEKNNTPGVRLEEYPMNPAGGAKPKQISTRARGKKNKKVRGRQDARKKAQKKNTIKKQGTAEARWGLDESSESDGDWDCDGGDVPLLRR